MNQLLRGVLATVAVCVSSGVASSQLIIVPTFDVSITADPNSLAMMTAINLAIAQEQSFIKNLVIVNITFKNVNTGLGTSATYYGQISYSQYLADLHNNQILSAKDTTALATLPDGANNPVNDGTIMIMTRPLLRALGESVLGDNTELPFDSEISLNMSQMNLLRTGPQDPDKYDLQQVVLHEMQEVLGGGGGGSQLSSGGSNVGPLDLFRYSAAGTRSYSASAASAYFSIDGGATNLSFFNQSAGADYADWADSPPNMGPQVQDAFSTPGVQLNLSVNEMTSIDIIGWNITALEVSAVPVPATALLFGPALLVGALVRRYRNRANT